MKPALLVDNYDSYTHNVYHLLTMEMGGLEPVVVQNDAYHGDFSNLLRDLDAYSCIVISPGPGNPNDDEALGLSKHLLLLDVNIPILGICLGMQAITLRYGGTVLASPKPMHGLISQVDVIAPCLLLEGIPAPFGVVRYHSLQCVLDKAGGGELIATSLCQQDQVIMSLRHRSKPIFGVQFHPESICAGEAGRRLISNFCSFCGFVAPPSPSLLKEEVKRLRVSSAFRVECTALPRAMSAEAYVSSLRASADVLCWLDSSSSSTSPRFSYVCDTSGPFQERIEVWLVDGQAKRMKMDDTHEQLRHPGSARVRCVQDGKVVSLTSLDPFGYVKQRLETYHCDANNLNVPFDFWGGFVGVVGYGCRKLCGVQPAEVFQCTDALEETAAPDFAFYLASRVVVFDHHANQVFVVVMVDDHHVTQTEWMQHTAQRLRMEEPRAPAVTSRDSILLHPLTLQTQYLEAVDASLLSIAKGDTYEVCLTNQFEGQIPPALDPWDLYVTMRRNNPAPMSAYFRLPGKVSLLSTSPERFISVTRQGVVQSRPIKGTVARDLQDKVLDERYRSKLQGSEKDRAENLMIVDLVRNDLGRVCKPGSVCVPDLMVVESFQTVHQLVSTIRGTLKTECSAVDACRACFPPGSMTGAPKLKTMQIIDSLEHEERGLYSGCLGFFSCNGAADFSVLIRTAVVAGTQLRVGAGGAVIALSSAQEEYNEMRLKLNTLGNSFSVHEST